MRPKYVVNKLEISEEDSKKRANKTLPFLVHLRLLTLSVHRIPEVCCVSNEVFHALLPPSQ